MLKKYRIIKLFFLFLFFLPLSGCMTTGSGMGGAHEIEDVTPGERPSIESYEGGLWYHADKAEEALKSQRAEWGGVRYKDPKLEEYLRSVVCKVADDYCKDIRLYILNVPFANAFMMPNGVMVFTTGELLRFTNEAQLATVVGHEIGHYIKKHGIKRQLDAKAKSDLAGLISTILIGTVPMTFQDAQNFYDLINMITVGSISAYSRFHESEADAFGLEAIAKAGYELDEAVKTWETIVAEGKLHDRGTHTEWFDSHPAPPERVENLRELAKNLKEAVFPIINEDIYYQHIAPHTGKWLENLVSLKNFKSANFVIDLWYGKNKNLGELDYYKGEVYFARSKDDDLEKAIKHYKKSINQEPDFYLPYRRLGLIYYKKNDQKFKEYFRKYVNLKPDAKDRLMIESYISE